MKNWPFGGAWKVWNQRSPTPQSAPISLPANSTSHWHFKHKSQHKHAENPNLSVPLTPMMALSTAAVLFFTLILLPWHHLHNVRGISRQSRNGCRWMMGITWDQVDLERSSGFWDPERWSPSSSLPTAPRATSIKPLIRPSMFREWEDVDGEWYLETWNKWMMAGNGSSVNLES